MMTKESKRNLFVTAIYLCKFCLQTTRIGAQRVDMLPNPFLSLGIPLLRKCRCQIVLQWSTIVKFLAKCLQLFLYNYAIFPYTSKYGRFFRQRDFALVHARLHQQEQNQGDQGWCLVKCANLRRKGGSTEPDDLVSLPCPRRFLRSGTLHW